MAFFRQLKHGDGKARPFYFGIEHHELRLVCHNSYTPTQVTIAWIRGSRREQIEPKRILRSSLGENVFLQIHIPPQRILFPITLYKCQEDDSSYMSKFWTVQVEELKRNGKRKILAEVDVNLAAFALEDFQPATPEKRVMHLNPVRKDSVLSCEVQVTIASICVEAVETVADAHEEAARNRERNSTSSWQPDATDPAPAGLDEVDHSVISSPSQNNQNAIENDSSDAYTDSQDDEKSSKEVLIVGGCNSGEAVPKSRRQMLSLVRRNAGLMNNERKTRRRTRPLTIKTNEKHDRLTIQVRRVNGRSGNLLLAADQTDGESPDPCSVITEERSEASQPASPTVEQVDAQVKTESAEQKCEPALAQENTTQTDEQPESITPDPHHKHLAIICKVPSTAAELEEQGIVLQELLQWVRSSLREYKSLRATNFTTSFRNGLVLCAMLHHFLPDCLPDFEQMKALDMERNNRLAFRLLAALGVRTSLQPADIVNAFVVDKLKVAHIVLQLRRIFDNRAACPIDIANLLSIATSTDPEEMPSEMKSESESTKSENDLNATETEEQQNELSFADRRRVQIVEDMRKQAIMQCRQDTLIQLYARRASIQLQIYEQNDKSAEQCATKHELSLEDEGTLVDTVTAHAVAKLKIIEQQMLGIAEQMKGVERRLRINAKHREELKQKMMKKNWLRKLKKKKMKQRAALVAGLSTVAEDEDDDCLLPAAYDEDTVMMQWLGLIECKNQLAIEMERLKLVLSEERLSKHERIIRTELQKLNEIAEWQKTYEERARESSLIEDLLKTISERDELVNTYHNAHHESNDDSEANNEDGQLSASSSRKSSIQPSQ